VVLGVDGIADFNALHSGKQNDQVQFCAFDVLAIDGEDIRDLPLSMRKTNLERLLRGRPDGIFINPFEIGAIGPDLFRAACGMGLEGLVSKHRERPYQAGRSSHWVKVKNPASAASEGSRLVQKIGVPFPGTAGRMIALESRASHDHEVVCHATSQTIPS
jgi:bifunctional non-homologous end joining protein LigD